MSVALALAMAGTASAQTPPRSDTVVRLATAPRNPGVARLVEVFSLGAENRGEDYLLFGVGSVLPARDGSIWVLNGAGPILGSGGASLRQYDASGRFLRRVAVRGQGPGEFFLPSALAQLPDGRILLRDNPPSPEKIHVYSEQGAHVTTWEWPRTEGSVRTNAWIVAGTDGTVYTQILMRDSTGAVGSPLGNRTRPARIGPTGNLVDVLPITDPSGSTAVWSPLGYQITAVGGVCAVNLRIPPPAPPGTRQTTAGRGGYTPPRVWSAGDPVVSIRRDVPAVPMSAEERRDREAMAAARSGRGSRAAGAPPRAPEVIPENKPPIRGITVGADGRIWVRVSVTSERYTPPPPANAAAPAQLPWREPNVFDVFEPDGTYVGRVAIPYDARPMHMRGDIVWGVVVDADRVETIKRWRLEWR